MAKEDLSIDEVFIKILNKLVEEAVKSSSKKLNEQEIKDIIINIMPNLDQMIANKIKEHFIIIAEFIQEKFNPEKMERPKPWPRPPKEE